MKYKIANDVPIGLLKAVDLKEVAIRYEKKAVDEPFPLANFIQNGCIDIETFVY